MKKVYTALVSALLVAVAVFTFGACGVNNTEKVKVIDVELTSEEYAFAVQKGNNTLTAQINSLLTEMKADGTLKTLIDSYFDGTATFSYTNQSNQPQADDFVMATNAYFPPFESYNESTAFVGVDVELAHKVAQKLGKTLFVFDMEFDSIIPYVQNNANAVGMAGITVNDERKLSVDFADGYYESAQVITVRENDDTFADCRSAAEIEAILQTKGKSYTIGTQAGTTGFMYSNGDEGFGYDGFTNLTTKAYSTGALAMQDLANGKIDAVILDKQPSLMIAASINAKK